MHQDAVVHEIGLLQSQLVHNVHTHALVELTRSSGRCFGHWGIDEGAQRVETLERPCST